jgi:hypothetical protein
MYAAIQKGVTGVVPSIMRFQVVIILLANIFFDGVIPSELAFLGVMVSTAGMIVISVGKKTFEAIVTKCAKSIVSVSDKNCIAVE